MMTDSDCARTLEELDRLLNDPNVPLQPSLIWRLLDEVSEQDLSGATLAQILGSVGDAGHSGARSTRQFSA
jgi:hypothetical protein